MQRSILLGTALALAIVAAPIVYWLVREPDVATHAATAATAARDAPVFLREEPEAPAASAPAARAQVDEVPALVEPAKEEAAPAQEPESQKGIVAGRIVDRSRAPVAGAAVTCKFPPLEAASGEDGRFALECAVRSKSKQRKLSLTLAHAGFAPLRVEATVAADETTELGDLVLTPAGAISGRTVDEQGRAFQSAEVCITNADVVPHGPAYAKPWNSVVEGSSDANGRFRIAEVPAGSLRVWAGANEHMWAVSEPVEVRELGEVYDVVLTIRPVALEDMIRLTVVDPDGKPVPEARITYTAQRGGSSWSGSTQADDKGQYTHRLSVRTPHDFGASDPEQRFGAAQAKAVQPGTLDLVLQLTVRRVIAIEVVDEKGEPVKKYSVELREVRERGRPLSEYGDGDEHEGGRVELALPAAPFEIVVDALGYEVATLGPYDPASAPSEVRAELQSLPGVRGVVTAGGKPVSGAEVSAHAFVAADHELVVNGFRSRTRMDGESSAKTDEHGEFVLTPRKDDRYVVRAELDGWAPGESEPFDLDASAGASGIAIELVRGGAVEGHAAPGPGEGLAGLIVGASRGDGRGVTTRTDAEGKFRFDGLTPGRWWVGRHDQEISPNSTSSSSGNTTRRDEIEWNCVVRDGETTRVDVPAPAQDSVVLRGQLAFGGAAAAGWKATLHAQGVIGVPPREAQLDERGRFEVTAKEAGDYYLIVSPGSTHGSDVRVTQRVSLVDGANSWELDVPVGRIDGRVASAASDESEQYVWNWRRENGLSVQGSLDPAPDGSFAIERAPAGTIKFSAWPNEGKARELKSVELAAGASLRVEL